MRAPSSNMPGKPPALASLELAAFDVNRLHARCNDVANAGMRQSDDVDPSEPGARQRGFEAVDTGADFVSGAGDLPDECRHVPRDPAENEECPGLSRLGKNVHDLERIDTDLLRLALRRDAFGRDGHRVM